MEEVMEQTKALLAEGSKGKPSRRRYEEAFERAEEEADESLEEHIVPQPTIFNVQVQSEQEQMDVLTNGDSPQHKPDQSNTNKGKTFECQVPNCLQIFQSATEYQKHYNAKHMHACAICKKSLPSYHILELHVLELHDTFFSLMAEKKPMFQCFLETCQEQFANPEDRKVHCMSAHKFPEKFLYWQIGLPKKEGTKNNRNARKNHQKANKSDGEELPLEEVPEIESSNSNSNGNVSNSKGSRNKPKDGNNSSVPKHIGFGHSPHRAFKKNHSFGVESKKVPPSIDIKNTEQDRMDLKDIQEALVSSSVPSANT